MELRVKPCRRRRPGTSSPLVPVFSAPNLAGVCSCIEQGSEEEEPPAPITVFFCSSLSSSDRTRSCVSGIVPASRSPPPPAAIFFSERIRLTSPRPHQASTTPPGPSLCWPPPPRAAGDHVRRFKSPLRPAPPRLCFQSSRGRPLVLPVDRVPPALAYPATGPAPATPAPHRAQICQLPGAQFPVMLRL
ncbi:vegetative cell wall protein gp1-like [Triticum dicoccoides]|uniref:vegetative cell wall protein gp1-like n=1 Tax=Triticum dicoccoides TaxID=85692 RepID=UPI00188FDABC|nr:vegetative cell wall protein gp1-like [Triticum dicoccoides]